MRVTRGATQVNNARIVTAAYHGAQAIRATGNVAVALPQYLKALAEGLADPVPQNLINGKGEVRGRGDGGADQLKVGGDGQKI